MFNNIKNTFVLVGASAMLLTSCYDPTQKSEEVEGYNNNTGVEYAPQMYHSEAYDPLSQITDKDAGLTYWPFNEVGTDKELGGQKHGEWYNSNYWNPHEINMREPAPHTIRRGDKNFIAENAIGKNDLELAGEVLINPIVLDSIEVKNEDGTVSKRISPEGQAVFTDCEMYYMRFCEHCHGAEGKGDGLVAKQEDESKAVVNGVPNYHSAAIKDKPAGHIYHVITYGKGLMGSHASQLSPEERWKIVTYVQYLQKN